MTNSRRYLGFLAGTALLFGLSAIPTPANAGQDFQDPVACSGSSPLGAQGMTGYGGIVGGYVDLRYSSGCGIAWTRLCINGGNGFAGISATRTKPTGHGATTSGVAGSGTGGCGSAGTAGAQREWSYGLIDANCSNGGALPDWGGVCKVRSYGKIVWYNPGSSTPIFNELTTSEY